jgi:hypothetical protein
MNEYNSSDQLNSCINGKSAKPPTISTESTDTETPSASHIIMKAAMLLDSKLNQKRKTSITKVEKQINSLVNIFSPPTGSE